MRLKLLSIIIFLSCISLFISLGFWQLDRASEKENIVKIFKERQLSPVSELKFFSKDSLEKKYYKNYKIRGRYINKTFLIDNKIKDKQLGFNVITPFKLSSSGEIIIVDRGWISMIGERKDIDKNFNFLDNQNLENSVQEINGYIYPREKSYTIGEISSNKSWPRLLQAINFDEIKNSIEDNDMFISGVVFRLNSDNKFGFNREWKIVFMDSNKHIGYAFQWFSMAAALVILTIFYFLRKKDE